jgi:hypothetical protein
MNSILLHNGNSPATEPHTLPPSFSCRCSALLLRLTLNTPSSTRGGDPGGSIGLRRASDGRAGAVNKRERKALGTSCALAKLETAIDALSETAIDTCHFSTLARRVYVESAELGIQLLGVNAVLESETTVTCCGCSWRLWG